MTAFPKAERVEDPEYLDHCRGERCSFCRRSAPSDPHHVELKGMGGATLRDDRAVPACGDCHNRCHGRTVWVNGERMGPIPVATQEAAAELARMRYLEGLSDRVRVDPVPW